ncbi:hypothetical protein Taro_006936 [Colocasia esculenta]|uniref:B-block binding subunit of TFIIIC domain-containing protein n=1 Tax=Colocasia esculenta TaxID=4460 RepID=A0A843TYD6_COLES|nr:hypothetical protein [Colocasia esculenta]
MVVRGCGRLIVFLPLPAHGSERGTPTTPVSGRYFLPPSAPSDLLSPFGSGGQSAAAALRKLSGFSTLSRFQRTLWLPPTTSEGMDAIISTATEEICAEGPAGISIPKLWRSLRGCLASAGLEMDSSVKEAIWRRLLALPIVQFSVQGASLDPRDPSIQSHEQSEKLGLKVAAADHVRDCFLGIYDMKAVNVEMTPMLKQVLERVAVARSDGIAQSLLSKEFKVKENKLFYFLKKLESQGLIVRQSTILRTKETATDADDEMKDGSIVNTNLVYLYRYARRLSSLQRLEIAKSDVLGIAGDADGSHLVGDQTCEEPSKEDVHVKDYLPEMKAICDMLDEASGKVAHFFDTMSLLSRISNWLAVTG